MGRPVGKGAQVIHFVSELNATYGQAALTLEGNATSGLSLGYSSSNPSVAEVNGSKLLILGSGTSVITAYQGGNANFDAAPDRNATLQVGKATLTVKANDASKAYLAAVPSLSYELLGFVNDENASVLSLIHI